MATSTTILSGICEADHITKCADYWCPECEEGLCSDCHKHHSLSKATRKHQSISISDYQKLPAFIAEITETCSEHDMKFTHYCKQHDQVCCPGCLSTQHKTCTDVQLLTEVIQKSKTSAMLSSLEEHLAEIMSFIEHGILNRKENISNLDKEQQSIKEEIQEVRRKINAHLDVLEKTLLKKLEESHLRSVIQSSVKQLSEKVEAVNVLNKSLTAVTKYGSDLQAFFGVRKTNEKVDDVVKYLKSKLEYQTFCQISLVRKIDVKIKDILGLTSFGEVDVDATTALLEYEPKDERAALVIHRSNKPTLKSIHDINLHLLSSFNVYSESYMACCGCTVCHNGKIILSDRRKHRLVFFNGDGSFDKDIIIPGATSINDVTVMDQDTVAVSCNNGIQIVDVNKETVKTGITTDNECYGVTYDKGSLVWCETGKGIKTRKLSDKKVSTIMRGNLPDYSYLTIFGDDIYFTDYKNKLVECVSRDGQTKWQFKDDSILSDPTCIIVDNDMFIYVTSHDSHDVVAISPDGKQGRQLLSGTNNLFKPRGICFDKTTNNLLIVNQYGKAFLYRVK